jgi:hypothetical protein
MPGLLWPPVFATENHAFLSPFYYCYDLHNAASKDHWTFNQLGSGLEEVLGMLCLRPGKTFCA